MGHARLSFPPPPPHLVPQFGFISSPFCVSSLFFLEITQEFSRVGRKTQSSPFFVCVSDAMDAGRASEENDKEGGGRRDPQ